ncbi:MAG: hypothetical protein RLY93_12400 [Sumerlaeia bacterium]
MIPLTKLFDRTSDGREPPQPTVSYFLLGIFLLGLLLFPFLAFSQATPFREIRLVDQSDPWGSPAAVLSYDGTSVSFDKPLASSGGSAFDALTANSLDVNGQIDAERLVLPVDPDWSDLTLRWGAFTGISGDDGKIYLVSSGERMAEFAPSLLQFYTPVDFSSAATFGGTVKVPVGSEDNPSIGFLLDTDTGIYSPGSGSIGLTSGGGEVFSISENGALFRVELGDGIVVNEPDSGAGTAYGVKATATAGTGTRYAFHGSGKEYGGYFERTAATGTGGAVVAKNTNASATAPLFAGQASDGADVFVVGPGGAISGGVRTLNTASPADVVQHQGKPVVRLNTIYGMNRDGGIEAGTRNGQRLTILGVGSTSTFLSGTAYKLTTPGAASIALDNAEALQLMWSTDASPATWVVIGGSY